MRATLTIEFSDRHTLNAVNASLLPDNIGFPEGMKFSQRKKGKELEIIIEMSRNKTKIETLISTLDEIVSHIHSASSTLTMVENLND
ncbi:MAG: hypothetical protein JRN52_10225 [Nitrososphaerota archaeon]|nr:hypothetical protein [Nitrososphaerota archaeon]